MTYPQDYSLEERRSIILNITRFHGRDDFLFSREKRTDFTDIFVYADSEQGLTPLEVEAASAAYNEGWQQAQAECELDGVVLFCLHELLTHMQTDQENSAEWYGTSFDEPMELVKRAIAGLSKEQET